MTTNQIVKYYSPKLLKQFINEHKIYQRLCAEKTFNLYLFDIGEVRALYAQVLMYCLFDIISYNEGNTLINMTQSKDINDLQIASVIIKNKQKQFNKLKNKKVIDYNINIIIDNYYDKIYCPSWDYLLNLNNKKI